MQTFTPASGHVDLSFFTERPNHTHVHKGKGWKDAKPSLLRRCRSLLSTERPEHTRALMCIRMEPVTEMRGIVCTFFSFSPLSPSARAGGSRSRHAYKYGGLRSVEMLSFSNITRSDQPSLLFSFPPFVPSHQFHHVLRNWSRCAPPGLSETRTLSKYKRLPRLYS